MINTITVHASIDKILVMEDRAQVTRVGQATLEQGRNQFVIPAITPMITDRTIRFRIRGEDTGTQTDEPPKLLDIQVQRHYVMRQGRPDQEKQMEAAFEAIRAEYLDVFDQTTSEFKQRHLLGNATSSLKRQICNRLVMGPFDQKWEQELKGIFSARAKTEESILEHQAFLREQLLRWQRLEEEREKLLVPTTDYNANLAVEVSVPCSGTYAIEVDYQVPCALWRPVYTAMLMESDKKTKLNWRSEGMVWQSTGEDWLNVNLEFSTARPTLGAELPLFSDDVLQVREKSDQERKVTEVSSREEAIEKTGAVRRSDTPPGLEDGGEVRVYKVNKRVDLPADGRPHKFEFENWDAETQCTRACYPEKADFVFLKSTNRNLSNMPLLSGPVSLIRNGGFIGRSEISYVASGEQMDLSWGSEDAIVVLRDVTKIYDESGFRKKRHFHFEVVNYLANHSNQKQAIKLTERIPISEIEQVDIELKKEKTTPGFTKDDFGLLEWTLELQPNEEKTTNLAFEVSMPHSVVWQP